MLKLSSIPEFILRHRTIFKAGLSIATAISEAKKFNNPLALVAGGFDMINTTLLDAFYTSDDFFAKRSGWNKINKDVRVSLTKIFQAVLNKYPSTIIPFKSDRVAYLYKHPVIGELARLSSQGRYIDPDSFYSKMDPEEVINILIKECFADLNSNMISINVGNNISAQDSFYVVDPMLIAETPDYIEGASDILMGNIKPYLDKGIARSYLISGPPGIGKTVSVGSVCKDLNMRTLKLRSNVVAMDLDFLVNIVKLLGIEAIIIDDFDQLTDSNRLLELLGALNKEVKLLFGIVNSLKEFHPAVIRPARFDEIITIDQLGIETVKTVLGDELYAAYKATVKKWPIAYLNELKKRSLIMNGDKIRLDKAVKELDNRVKRQLKILK